MKTQSAKTRPLPLGLNACGVNGELRLDAGLTRLLDSLAGFTARGGGLQERAPGQFQRFIPSGFMFGHITSPNGDCYGRA